VPVVVVRRVVVIGVEHDDLGRIGVLRIQRMDVQLAEGACQVALLHRRHRLVFEEEHMAAQQRGKQVVALCAIDGAGQVKSGDQRTDGGAQGLYGNRHGTARNVEARSVAPCAVSPSAKSA